MTGDLMHGVGVLLVFFVVLVKQDASGLSLHSQVIEQSSTQLPPPNAVTQRGPYQPRLLVGADARAPASERVSNPWAGRDGYPLDQELLLVTYLTRFLNPLLTGYPTFRSMLGSALPAPFSLLLLPTPPPSSSFCRRAFPLTNSERDHDEQTWPISSHAS
jgi:hypothetical protein